MRGGRSWEVAGVCVWNYAPRWLSPTHDVSCRSVRSFFFSCSRRSFDVTVEAVKWHGFNNAASFAAFWGYSVASPAMGHWGTCPPLDFQQFHFFSLLWSKSDSQLSKYCVVCEISWCRCQQLAALSISTALVTEQLLHPTLKSAVSAPWPYFQLCPSATNPGDTTEDTYIVYML